MVFDELARRAISFVLAADKPSEMKTPPDRLGPRHIREYQSCFQMGIVRVLELFCAVVRIGDCSKLNVYLVRAKTTDRTRIANRWECARRCR